ncbi:hypothetical protein VTN77DRAFT_5060 [Rasamsonia byssochlamydoides]|uniref:uncharacterized protein n=1 Tax=Rasamsonia byssochlamydoides TaxID=89139 RepID=UPI003743EB35
MMRANDPRIRQTINQISQNLESANETAQEGFYTFSQEYLAPCFASIANCVRACTAPCFPSREDQLRRRRRGRAEFNFDFYDDWYNDDGGDGLLGWGNDELDRLLAGSGSGRGGAEQPRRQRKMSYGAARAGKRRSTLPPDQRDDPTVIPKSSVIGFLERFPWRIGPRGIKYRPSAADLQERPGRLRGDDLENQPLMEAADESDGAEYGEGSGGKKGKNGRDRSETQSSRETSNSLSSRGDLIPSDEEEDAVPLDDEFAVALARRGTGLTSDDQLSGRPSFHRQTTSGTTSRDSRSTGRGKDREGKGRSPRSSDVEIIHDDTPPMAELVKEEETARLEEESEIARKRRAAHQLAVSQGLAREDQQAPSSAREVSTDERPTEPFPPLPVTPTSIRSAPGAYPSSVTSASQVETASEADTARSNSERDVGPN